MKKIILFIWQLPQNFLGLLVILFTHVKQRFHISTSIKFYHSNINNFGVSLGNFIVLGGYYESNDLKHEFGHHKQSLYLGWLYLLIIGIPSFLGNIYDRLFHKNWQIINRVRWYYNQPWEKWVDKLGNVNRFNLGV